MKTNLDAAAIWRDIEEHLTPAFALWASDRVVYFYLARQRLLGRSILRMPARLLSRATLLSRSTVRLALRRLAARGIIRILSRSYRGLRITVKLPREIRGCVSETRLADGRKLESLDFWTSKIRRALIFRRDGNRCFYCLRRLRRGTRVLDHVIPRARIGQNSYRNLVACCPGCNMTKRDAPAAHLLRKLYRDARLTAAELRARLAALKTLASGKLKPVLLAARRPT